MISSATNPDKQLTAEKGCIYIIQSLCKSVTKCIEFCDSDLVGEHTDDRMLNHSFCIHNFIFSVEN